jgi:hypothetical protein
MNQLVGSPRRRRSGDGPFAPIADTREKLKAVVAYRSSRRTRRVQPWIPSDYASLPADRRATLLDEFQHYATVDDLEEDPSSGTVVLIVTPWPGIDSQGRMRFARTDDGERTEQIVDQAADQFRTFVNKFRCRLSEDGFPVAGFAGEAKILQERPIRIGDAFALNDAACAALRGADQLDPVLLFDITKSARELAKISYYAAAAGVLDAAVNEELARLAWEEQSIAREASE